MIASDKQLRELSQTTVYSYHEILLAYDSCLERFSDEEAFDKLKNILDVAQQNAISFYDIIKLFPKRNELNLKSEISKHNPMHINNEEPNLQPAPKKPEMFNLAKMFHAHLKLMNVDLARLKPYEIKAMKLAFYGGISCHIIMLGQSLQGSEEDATVILKNIDDQLNEYWKSENIDFNLN